MTTNSLEAKICILGAQGVGKTSLLHRYVRGTFDPPSVSSTIGASFLVKKVVDADSGTTVRLQLWDTAGQERFRAISRLYYRGASAVLLVYSMLDEQSFKEMGRWLLEMKENIGDDVVIHIVGTKADLVAKDPNLRQVSLERCIDFVADNACSDGTYAHQQTHQGQYLQRRQSTPPLKTISSAQCHNVSPTSRHHRQTSQTHFTSHSPTSPVGNSSGSSTSGAHTLDGVSKRSSSFWGLDMVWDCCHEISSSSGEGIEEVFRVITRKLVEKHTIKQEALRAAEAAAAATASMTEAINGRPGLQHYGSGRSGELDGHGSFRLGYGDRRRSWLGLTGPSIGVNTAEARYHDRNGCQYDSRKRGCC